MGFLKREVKMSIGNFISKDKAESDFRKYFIKNQGVHFVNIAATVWSRKGILSLEKCQNLTLKEVLI